MCRAILLIALLPIVVYTTSNILDCGSLDNFPTEVHVLGCDEAPCELRRGDLGITHVKWVVPHDIVSFYPTVKARIGFFVLDYKLPDDVKIGCNWILNGESCPLTGGTEVFYELRQEVDPASPTLAKPELTFNILDHNNQTLACWRWTASIV